MPVFDDSEFLEEAAIRKFRITASDGKTYTANSIESTGYDTI